MKILKRTMAVVLSLAMLLSVWTAPSSSVADAASSNEEIVFAFLADTMKFNDALISGVMANIAIESKFDPNATFVERDGSVSYGLCQWRLSRQTALFDFCSKNGYPRNSIMGQLLFMKYELETSEKSAMKYLENISNDANGAYLAGLNFATYYERCAVSGRTQRGIVARDTYWPIYSNIKYTVTYHANGGSGIPAAQQKKRNNAINLAAANPSRAGFEFMGWSEGKPSSLASYMPGDVYSGNSDINLYAVWKPVRAGVIYSTHIQSHGWQDWKFDGVMSGTSGAAKRLEAIKIELGQLGIEGDVEYRTHIQSYGWQDWKKNGELSGTSGEAKRLEAIQVRLTGEIAEYYDIYYRVHAQSFGWLGWAKNGEPAGTSGYAKRLEGIEIVLVEKDNPAPGSVTNAYLEKLSNVLYSTHIQRKGWEKEWARDGGMSGTSGEAKRLEAIRVKLVSSEYSGSIEYRTHIQSYGWQEWKKDGAVSGTSGEGKRLEAIEIRLTGEIAEKYDVYYRVHAQSFGWLGWAKNGESAGTAGLSKRLEAIEIVIVEKGKPAPGSTARCFVQN